MRVLLRVWLHNCGCYSNQAERVQALADISRSALCCHSNETVYRLQIRTILHN